MGTKLADLDKKLWSNRILWDLAVALGRVDENESQAYIDSDEILEEAIEAIWRYKELEY